MTMLDEQDLAALALTSRLVDADVRPLSSREFWALRQSIEPSALLGIKASEIAAELSVSEEQANRISGLIGRIAGLAIAIEKLDHSGIWTVTGVGSQYPAPLRSRLGDAAPVVLHGVGDVGVMEIEGVGVVGSRNISEEGCRVAREIAAATVKAGLPLVSGAARGADSAAMNGAVEIGGQVVGVLADSLERVVSRRSTRQGVAKGQICLVTPYTPSSSFSVGNAMGRNKIVYGLLRCTIVVASDHGSGGTWAGAIEALKNSYGCVASWTGPGSGAGNTALVDKGAIELSDVAQLGEVLDDSVDPPSVKPVESSDQLTLGF